MPSAQECPSCGRRLSADAPEGLCAACLFKAGLEGFGDRSPSGDSVSATAAGSGDPECGKTARRRA